MVHFCDDCDDWLSFDPEEFLTLITAASQGRRNSVRTSFREGADIDPLEGGQNALDHAIYQGRGSIPVLLLAPDAEGSTAGTSDNTRDKSEDNVEQSASENHAFETAMSIAKLFASLFTHSDRTLVQSHLITLIYRLR
jgi:hypothetical protein